MVIKYNRIFFAILFALSFSALSNETREDLKLKKVHANPFNDAFIISFDGSPSNFILKKITIDKPKEKLLKKIKLLSDDDKYAIKVFGKDDKYLYTIGIGNPFYANYQHIGFEDRQYMGGLVTSALVEVAIPLHIQPSSFIISKRDITGKFIDIQQLYIN
mgnify:CR=1 FL=1|tara:strand:+ start:249 stop:728 length:480 start_codon:yes stop_codon:yes gene_type:complete